MDAQPTPRAGSSRRRMLQALLVALGAALVLAAHAPLFDPSRLHVHGHFVDQALYVTTARTWVESGELKSGLVYPAYLEDPRWRLYMPGHFALLAASYALLGWGVVQTLLPSLLAHVVATVSVFLLASRLAGARAGFLGAGLYACLPVVLLYAFTAMAEATFAAAAALALAIFVHVPARWRIPAAALLTGVPFLFRETGALCVLPMAALVLADAPRRGRWTRAALCVLAAAPVCAALHSWQVASGKGTIPVADWVQHGRFNYTGVEPEPEPLEGLEWLPALRRNLARNLDETVAQVRADPGQPSVVGLGLVLFLGGACLAAGLLRRRGPPSSSASFALGAGLCVVGMLVLLYLLYDAQRQRAMRNALVTLPACAAAVGALGAPILRSRRAWGTVLVAAAVGLAGGAWPAAARAGADLRRMDPCVDDAGARLRTIGHDPAELLVVDVNAAAFLLDFAVQEFPLPVSFLPFDVSALQSLAERHTVGTIVLLGDRAGPRSIGLPTPDGGSVVLRPARRLTFGRPACGVSELPCVVYREVEPRAESGNGGGGDRRRR